ncbi:hypothetical protein Tco_0710822, partial [Tanacetum coccineum]
FYPTYLTTLAGRRWLLSHGVQLVPLNCLKSSEYQGILGHALGRAVDFGMQAGLKAGHEHGSTSRSLSMVDAYNPEAAKANYIDAVKALEDVDFPLVNLLKSKKDAGMDEYQDSLNAAAGGNLLNRTPRDALTIIENKLKVRISRNKLVVSKVSTTTSSPSPSPDVTALTEIVKELVLMNKATQQATVRAIEETRVTCGGPHPYCECLATGGNTFDACAAVGTYNQGGNGYRPQGDPYYRASNQMGPLMCVF